jgi:hypothetical protein
VHAVIAINGAAHAQRCAAAERPRFGKEVCFTIAAIWGARGLKQCSRSAAWVDLRLPIHPFDQLVELDRLLGRGQAIGERKSVLSGGLIRFAGGRGYGGHWRCSPTAAIGCGWCCLAAQLLSTIASSGKALL